MEQLQGELFDEAEEQPVAALLLGRKNKATASGGGTFTCYMRFYLNKSFRNCNYLLYLDISKKL